MDPIKHKKYTGVSNDLILENAINISLASIPMVIHIPIIPSYNDDFKNINSLAKFVSKLKSVEDIIYCFINH